MWERAFVQSFIEVLPLISPFLMQFKIKEMKGRADCEWFYKQDSQGALRRQFCKRLWVAIPRKDRGGRVAVPLCWGMWPQDGRPACPPGRLTFWVQIGGDGGQSTGHHGPESGSGGQKA